MKQAPEPGASSLRPTLPLEPAQRKAVLRKLLHGIIFNIIQRLSPHVSTGRADVTYIKRLPIGSKLV